MNLWNPWRDAPDPDRDRCDHSRPTVDPDGTVWCDDCRTQVGQVTS